MTGLFRRRGAPSRSTTGTSAAERGARRSARLLIVPLVLVTCFAVYGQVGAAYENLRPVTEWPNLERWTVSVGASAAFESIALYVQWQAHQLLLLGATAEAAGRRRVSYLFALVSGVIQWSHFSDGWAPTASAVVFAAFSVMGPWLWGMHTRHVSKVNLIRAGQLDSMGAVFSAERWRAFPRHTWRARKLSIDLAIDDPREAWRLYRETTAHQHGAGQSEVPPFDPPDLDPADEGEAVPAPPVDEPRTPAPDVSTGDLQLIATADLIRAAVAGPSLSPTGRTQLRGELLRRAQAHEADRLPIDMRVELVRAAERVIGAEEPGRRRITELLGLPSDYPVRRILEAQRTGSPEEVRP